VGAADAFLAGALVALLATMTWFWVLGLGWRAEAFGFLVAVFGRVVTTVGLGFGLWYRVNSQVFHGYMVGAAHHSLNFGSIETHSLINFPRPVVDVDHREPA
jgi:hypothetical protein